MTFRKLHSSCGWETWAVDLDSLDDFEQKFLENLTASVVCRVKSQLLACCGCLVTSDRSGVWLLDLGLDVFHHRLDAVHAALDVGDLGKQATGVGLLAGSGHQGPAQRRLTARGL